MFKSTYTDSVFINCPFDKAYMPLLRACIFAVYRCGFYPVSALVEDNALDNRIDKITRLIKSCKYGFHDISIIELNKKGYPRFNMPFELGIFYGASKFGDKNQHLKNAIIFEKKKFSYQQYLSDINGVDTKAHNNDPNELIRGIRNWLGSQSRRKTLPSDELLIKYYNEFLQELPRLSKKLGFKMDEIPFNDYCTMVEEFIHSGLMA